MCDTDKEVLKMYSKICHTICKEKQIPAAISIFSDIRTLLFEMGDSAFSSMVNILIAEPDNGCGNLAGAVRERGYDGIILYLSRSAEKKYFYQAFNYNVHNYIEKGDVKVFERIFRNTLEAAQKKKHRSMVISCAGEYRRINVRDIYYFQTVMDHMICMWHEGGRIIFSSSLANLEERLKDRGFFRIHRSYLISLDTIRSISFKEVILCNGKCIPVSREKYSELKKIMEKRRV